MIAATQWTWYNAPLFFFVICGVCPLVGWLLGRRWR